MSGRLSIYLVSDPTEWHGGVDRGDRYLQLYLDGPEWEALFFDTLGCPEPEPYIEGENPEEADNRLRVKFQQAIPQYPMLSRLWDPYRHAGYNLDQVKRLRDECLKIQSDANNSWASAALGKLIQACEEAIMNRQGLFFVAD